MFTNHNSHASTRWHNQLDPKLDKSQISAEESRLIFEMHHSWGNRWSAIAKHLHRSENTVKNYFYSHSRKLESRLAQLLSTQGKPIDQLFQMVQKGQTTYQEYGAQQLNLSESEVAELEQLMRMVFKHKKDPPKSTSARAQDEFSFDNDSEGKRHTSPSVAEPI